MIIAICGKAGSGKSTVADMIKSRAKGRIEIFSLADPMKHFLFDMGWYDEEALWGPSESRQMPDLCGYGVTARRALQAFGTDFGRAFISPNCWIDAMLRDMADCTAEIALTTDCRFLNEMRAIKKAGGKLWRMTRGGNLTGDAAMHPSEMDLDTAEAFDMYDEVIPNRDWTLEQLEAHVAELLLRA